MDIVHVETGLDYLVRDMRLFAADLPCLGQKPGGAAWKLGEHHIITARAKTETTTELVRDNYHKVVEPIASETWARLLNSLQRNGIAIIPCGAMDSERAAKATLADMHPYRREDYPAWEAERAALATKTAEHAAEEFFATLGMDDTKPAERTDDAGEAVEAEGNGQSTATLDVRQLHEKMDRYFDDEDLQDLCFGLVDYDNLCGRTKSGKARELILWFEKRSRLDELVELLRQKRPNVSW